MRQNACSQITHSPTFGRAFTWEVSDPWLITHLLKMSKCELSLKVLQIANFSQLIHLLLEELSHGEVSDP